MQTSVGGTFDTFVRHANSFNAFSTRHYVDILSSRLGAQWFFGNFIQYTLGQYYSNVVSYPDLFGLHDDIFLPSQYSAAQHWPQLILILLPSAAVWAVTAGHIELDVHMEEGNVHVAQEDICIIFINVF